MPLKLRAAAALIAATLTTPAHAIDVQQWNCLTAAASAHNGLDWHARPKVVSMSRSDDWSARRQWQALLRQGDTLYYEVRKLRRLVAENRERVDEIGVLLKMPKSVVEDGPTGREQFIAGLAKQGMSRALAGELFDCVDD